MDTAITFVDVDPAGPGPERSPPPLPPVRPPSPGPPSPSAPVVSADRRLFDDDDLVEMLAQVDAALAVEGLGAKDQAALRARRADIVATQLTLSGVQSDAAILAIFPALNIALATAAMVIDFLHTQSKNNPRATAVVIENNLPFEITNGSAYLSYGKTLVGASQGEPGTIQGGLPRSVAAGAAAGFDTANAGALSGVAGTLTYRIGKLGGTDPGLFLFASWDVSHAERANRFSARLSNTTVAGGASKPLDDRERGFFSAVTGSETTLTSELVGFATPLKVRLEATMTAENNACLTLKLSLVDQ